MKRKRPTRRDLLIVIGRLQNAIGDLSTAYENDRAPDRAGKIQQLVAQAHRLCIEVRSFDPPIEGVSRRGWSD